MPELLPFLKDLISAPGLSGYEDPAARIIEDAWRPYVDEISCDRLGSLQGLRHGTGKEPRPSVMVATHMDSIGMMVTGIVDGFLRLTNIGGIDARVLPGTPVTVYATGSPVTGSPPAVVISIPAAVVQPPDHLLPDREDTNAPVALPELFVDAGLPPEKITQLVRVGDLVSFAQSPVELTGEALAGHSLDNRASVAALTVCLQELQTRPHAWDVWAVATTQEEVGTIGASSSAFALHPSIALAVDVTHAKGPGTPEWNTFALGKGPTIAWGPNIHPYLAKAMQKLADRLEIPYTQEFAPTHSGTDGMATQVAAEGIPTLVVGIPLRYMHTPVELVSLKDIQRTGRLLAEFITSLEPDFMERVRWDEP